MKHYAAYKELKVIYRKTTEKFGAHYTGVLT